MPIDPAARGLIQAMDASFPKLHEMPSGTEARRRIVEAMHDVESDRGRRGRHVRKGLRARDA